MYEKFTGRACKVMQLACEEALRFNHEYIGTEHILLGLAREGTGVAANVLLNLGIDLHKIRREVEKIVQPGPDIVTMGKLPQTPRAVKVIEYAIGEARILNHNYVDSEHLLLGMLRDDVSVAAQVLMNLGLSLASCRQEVRHLRGYFSEAGGAEIRRLPKHAREIVEAFDCQLDVIQDEKEEAIVAHDIAKAASLRELSDELTKLRDEFISHWPKS